MLYDIIALKITEYIALAVIVECTAAVVSPPAKAAAVAVALTLRRP